MLLTMVRGLAAESSWQILSRLDSDDWPTSLQERESKGRWMCDALTNMSAWLWTHHVPYCHSRVQSCTDLALSNTQAFHAACRNLRLQAQTIDNNKSATF